MKLLITGGTGLIGSAFIAAYKNHFQFTVLTRRADEFTGAGIGYQPLSWLDQQQNLNDFDAVINLAGEGIADKRWSNNRKDVICQSRWKITEKLTTLIMQSDNPPEVFISGSAVGYYGRQQDQLINDTYPYYFDEFSHHICHRWEALANGSSTKTRVCLIRTGIVLSDRGGALDKMLPPFMMGLGSSFGSGKQYMPWIHIDDQIAAIRFLLDNKQCEGPFNLTAPYPETNQNFSKLLANRLNRPLWLKTPAFVLKLMLGEMADLLIYGQNAIPEKLLNAGFEFRYPHLEQAFQDCIG